MEKEAGLEIKRGWHVQIKVVYTLKPSKAEDGRILTRSWCAETPDQAPAAALTPGPQEEQQHINFNNCSYFLSCQQLLT